MAYLNTQDLIDLNTYVLFILLGPALLLGLLIRSYSVVYVGVVTYY